MNKQILKLKDIIEKMDNSELGGSPGKVYLSLSILDDIFRILRKKEIKEVRVNFDEMFMIVQFAIASVNIVRDDGMNMNWDSLKIIQEGQIDKFFGIKLYLEE